VSLKGKNLAGVIFVMLMPLLRVTAQISPGDLSGSHSHLEGISNCTQCHVLGNKVSSEKCLICHIEIQQRISTQKGYHVSADVKGKECFVCHSDHNGKNFQLIRFDVEKFDHKLTGFSLSAPHARKECKDCHNTKFITDQKVKTKKYTYLGVNSECLNCHTDYHRKTLSSVCLNCHNPDAFKPASLFNHANARFQLVGKHKNLDCLKCHKVETIDGKKFQEFRGIQYSGCASCHKDPHQNKFGQNCRQCHNEESFLVVKGVKNFDHNKTDFRLEEKHLGVSCAACHKNKLTDPLNHDRCVSCHSDYHNKQFEKNGVSPDCSQCHTVKGFTLFSYTINQHNLGTFPLQGAHTATPCSDCHKKETKWNFREIGISCKDCHKDIHRTFIQAKYYSDANCKICHNESGWSNISFDHSITRFNLTGAHTKLNCRNCHITRNLIGEILRDEKGIPLQKFTGLSQNCSGCHDDKHYKQFEKNGVTNCTDCHGTENWKASKFDHNNTAFKLDGKHINVPCIKCHKPQQEGSYNFVKYKLKEHTCESCHS
jgi:nitrate/TMAO reductase-like tetraheme cytochrome c subunit